ncbi:uncharacterized protein LOC119299185 isoform X1 [Triticum dicoccoides]|nr:uncharacterized protein LOC119299185 isoform X1 [Triticum dicoccoides]
MPAAVSHKLQRSALCKIPHPAPILLQTLPFLSHHVRLIVLLSPSSADFPLDLIRCPFCGVDLETNVARTGSRAGQRFYKCVRYDARECRFFEFQKAYVRRMTTYQIARAQQQAGVLHLQMHAHPAGNMAHPANQAPLQANQGQNQQPAAPEAVLLNQIFRPVAASASGSHALGAEAFILAASNIMLTLLVLLFVVAIYFGGGN